MLPAYKTGQLTMLLFTLTDNTLLDKIIKFSIKNKLIIGLMTLFLILWGIWSVSRLPIDALPDITNNQVQILTTSPTLAAQEVETFITYPIEQIHKPFRSFQYHGSFR